MPRIAVIGAGAFGGWTALWLLRNGAEVELLDNWGPGNSRSSSGDESRVLRGMYGPHPPYYPLLARSLELWNDHQRLWKKPLFRPTGVLWLASSQHTYEAASLPLMESAGISVDELTVVEASRRFPVIRFPPQRRVYFEAKSGYLAANQACQSVVEAFMAEGGLYRQSHVRIKRLDSGVVSIDDGEKPIQAEHFVFACGPWLGPIARVLLGESYADLIRPTRQESIYFGTPAGDRRFSDEQLPVWIDNDHHIFYGIPGNRFRGFKIADDTRGPPFDPDSNDRTPTTEAIEIARNYLAQRFPELANAPVNETRTCSYENSPDGHYLIGRVPTLPHFWLVGGGSGHGFKMGPAIGEMVAHSILDDHPIDPLFHLERVLSPKKPANFQEL